MAVRQRDHPRMCGEHPISASVSARNSGSSPHVRGARSQRNSEALVLGIIPACAGSTEDVCHVRDRRRDHPRMCGEHDVCIMARVLATGSSPHVRGAPLLVVWFGLLWGIIPACAGSTPASSISHDGGRDHPRMCGEHSTSRPSGSPASGSSPHVRGALLRARLAGVMAGIIPACAGSTPPLL